VKLEAGGSVEIRNYEAVIAALPSPAAAAVAATALDPEVLAIVERQAWVPSVHAVYKVEVDPRTPLAEGLIMPCGPGDHPVATVHLLKRHKFAAGGLPADGLDFA